MDFEDYLHQRLYHGLTMGSFVGIILILALIARDLNNEVNSTLLLGVDAVVLLIYIAVGLLSHKKLLPREWAHPMIAFLLLCMMSKSISTQLITSDPSFISQPLLLLSLASAAFLSVGWYVGTAAALTIIWTPVLFSIYPLQSVTLLLLSLTALVVVGAFFVRWQRAQLQDRFELEQEVKVLRGFVPICASCKKIRDESGKWNELESYIQSRSEARFSHGSCPECTARFREEYNAVGQGR